MAVSNSPVYCSEQGRLKTVQWTLISRHSLLITVVYKHLPSLFTQSGLELVAHRHMSDEINFPLIVNATIDQANN